MCTTLTMVNAMTNQVLRLTTSTKEERHSAINRIREAMTKSGAVILDFKMFSNRLINFVFEIPHGRIPDLFCGLTGIGLNVLEEDGSSFLNTAGQHAGEVPDPDRDIPGTLQITFIHNDPDLRIKVPAFDL